MLIELYHRISIISHFQSMLDLVILTIIGRNERRFKKKEGYQEWIENV